MSFRLWAGELQSLWLEGDVSCLKGSRLLAGTYCTLPSAVIFARPSSTNRLPLHLSLHRLSSPSQKVSHAPPSDLPVAVLSTREGQMVSNPPFPSRPGGGSWSLAIRRLSHNCILLSSIRRCDAVAERLLTISRLGLSSRDGDGDPELTTFSIDC